MLIDLERGLVSGLRLKRYEIEIVLTYSNWCRSNNLHVYFEHDVSEWRLYVIR